jgi:hypothetical protein
MIRVKWLELYASWCAKIAVVQDVVAAFNRLFDRLLSEFRFAYEWFACHLSQA